MRNVPQALNERGSFLSEGDVADHAVVALWGAARVAGAYLPDRRWRVFTRRGSSASRRHAISAVRRDTGWAPAWRSDDSDVTDLSGRAVSGALLSAVPGIGSAVPGEEQGGDQGLSDEPTVALC